MYYFHNYKLISLDTKSIKFDFYADNKIVNIKYTFVKHIVFHKYRCDFVSWVELVCDFSFAA